MNYKDKINVVHPIKAVRHYLKASAPKEAKMKKKIYTGIAAALTIAMLTACGEDPELSRFRNDMESFCTKISEIDTDINNIDATADTAVDELLACLDDLDIVFQAFARLDFPEEFDYLETLSADAGRYMTEAVKNYHEAYANNSYNEYIAEYARQYYVLAYKRVQMIITFLHGEIPEDADLTVEYGD